jgi:hypothetical protein
MSTSDPSVGNAAGVGEAGPAPTTTSTQNDWVIPNPVPIREPQSREQFGQLAAEARRRLLDAHCTCGVPWEQLGNLLGELGEWLETNSERWLPAHAASFRWSASEWYRLWRYDGVLRDFLGKDCPEGLSDRVLYLLHSADELVRSSPEYARTRWAIPRFKPSDAFGGPIVVRFSGLKIRLSSRHETRNGPAETATVDSDATSAPVPDVQSSSGTSPSNGDAAGHGTAIRPAPTVVDAPTVSPNGPGEPGVFWWQGERSVINLVPTSWGLLVAVWQTVSKGQAVHYDTLMNGGKKVWTEEVQPGTVRVAVTRLNSQLPTLAMGWKLGNIDCYIVRKPLK